MKVNTQAKPIKFVAEDGETLRIRPSLMGEPYRDGVNISLDSGSYDNTFYDAFFTLSEVKSLHKFLGEYLNVEGK